MNISKISVKIPFFLSLSLSILFLLGIFSFETLKADSGTTIKLDYVVGRDASGNATGTVSRTVNAQAIKGNYLYTGGAGSGTACSQTAGNAEGCELKVYDISDPENPIFVAGRDANGNATGTTNVAIRTLVIKGDYLFVGGDGTGTTPCSQNEGEAEGCELKVYNISDPTNPIYVAGQDTDGSGYGSSFSGIFSLALKGNYLFVGNWSYTIPCAQTVGSAIGCELKVYNISDPTNPVYVAGRDADGSSSGDATSYIYSLTVKDDYLFVGKGGNTTACSQNVGSAIGCELQVYDISDPTNPVYVAGRDADGSAVGTGNVQISSLVVLNNLLFIGKQGDSTPCSQTPGSAQGCELQVYDISSSTNPVYVAGRDADGSEDGVNSGKVNSLFIKGNHLFVGKSFNTTPCSQTVGETHGCELQVYDISDPTDPVFIVGVDASGVVGGDGGSVVNTLIFQNHYLFLGKQGNTTPCSQTAGEALGCELQVYSFATFLNHSTSFTITQEINEELSLSLINPVTFDAILGLSGGSSFNSTSFSVATNNPTGYTATLHFSTTTALQRVGGGGYINNYSPIDPAVPDFTFSTPPSSHAFAFNVIGVEDIPSLFKHNGSLCGGAGNTSDSIRCWYNQSDATVPVVIVNRSTSNPLGSAYGLGFFIGVAPNPSPALPEGFYQATATVTVLPN